MKSQNKIVIKQNRTGEIVKFIADISKAKEIFNYEPKTDILEGVKRSIAWYKENLYPVRNFTLEILHRNEFQ